MKRQRMLTVLRFFEAIETELTPTWSLSFERQKLLKQDWNLLIGPMRLIVAYRPRSGKEVRLIGTRISVTNGLRVKLRDLMNNFQTLREKIVSEHKEGLKRRYYNATGEEPSEEAMEKMVSGSAQVGIFEGKTDLAMENQERHEALKDIQRSLTELHQVFLDMAVLIETQSEQINNIEQNVASAGSYIGGGTKELSQAKKMKKRRSWAFWIGIVMLVLLLVFLISILT
ncbi:hypothetical protein F0562_020565 [Nyssa sinensis]|uniref:t-SNARE coiled-coil homology domain-containing protein n=1 Tax=Nyssa sinensis TaxID=561372 RepID=A0A5J5BTK8_9ASTE|nr:hypothetical protein F0562_020565 [Nyssa sinensis]